MRKKVHRCLKKQEEEEKKEILSVSVMRAQIKDTWLNLDVQGKHLGRNHV